MTDYVSTPSTQMIMDTLVGSSKFIRSRFVAKGSAVFQSVTAHATRFADTARK